MEHLEKAYVSVSKMFEFLEQFALNFACRKRTP